VAIAGFCANRVRRAVLSVAFVVIAALTSIEAARGDAVGGALPNGLSGQVSPVMARAVPEGNGDAWLRDRIVRMAGQQKQSVNPRDIFRSMMVPGTESKKECKSADAIHKRLKRQGWWDFDALEREGKDFTVRARRPNGTAYKLTIEACTGRVLEANRLDNEGRGYRLWPR